MTTVVAIVTGFILDLIFGDPHSLPHPICLIGNLISFLERNLRKIFGFSNNGLLFGGGVLVLVVISTPPPKSKPLLLKPKIFRRLRSKKLIKLPIRQMGWGKL